jgi:hypothetical protein
MVLEPVYLTEKLRYIIQMFGSIVSACWLQIHLSFVANFSEQFIFSMKWFFSLLFRYFNSFKKLVATERSEATHYSWRAIVSPESTRPSLSRDLCIVEISILSLSGFRISGEIIKASGRFFKRGGRSNFILYCVRAYLHAVCWIFTNKSGKDGFISFWWYTWRHLYSHMLF